MQTMPSPTFIIWDKISKNIEAKEGRSVVFFTPIVSRLMDTVGIRKIESKILKLILYATHIRIKGQEKLCSYLKLEIAFLESPSICETLLNKSGKIGTQLPGERAPLGNARHLGGKCAPFWYSR